MDMKFTDGADPFYDVRVPLGGGGVIHRVQESGVQIRKSDAGGDFPALTLINTNTAINSDVSLVFSTNYAGTDDFKVHNGATGTGYLSLMQGSTDRVFVNSSESSLISPDGTSTTVVVSNLGLTVTNDAVIEGELSYDIDGVQVAYKRITGTTDNDNSTTIAHGLSDDNIIGVEGNITDGTYWYQIGCDWYGNSKYCSARWGATNIYLDTTSHFYNKAYKLYLKFEV